MSKIWDWIISFIGEGLKEFSSNEGALGRKYPNRLPVVRLLLWTFSSPLIIGSTLLILILFRILILYRHLSFLYQLEAGIPDFFSTSVDIKLTILTILTTILILLFTYQYWHSIPRPFSIKNLNINLFAYSALIIFSLWSLLPSSQKILTDFIESEAYYRVVLLTSDEKYDQALAILNPLRELTTNLEMKSQAQSQLVEIQSNLEQYRLSIENRVRTINSNIESVSPADIQSLHEDLFAFAEKVGLAESEKFLQELAEKYPRVDLNPIWAGVGKATSPIWLGITPENFQFLVNGDVYSIGVNSLDERANLQGLISRYPSDPLADWGRLIIGEHKEIADNEPNSRVRDWAIYKTGLDSYLQLDFPGCINYFTQFLDEFATHRWADDAAYRIARCYELQEQYELAVDYALLATELPDGKFNLRDNYIEMYAIALIDNYFDANRLENYILQIESDPSRIHFLPLLEYSLAEQLFKEARYVEASDAFQQVQTKYPTSKVAQYVPDNLLLIDQISHLLGQERPNNVIALVKYLLEDPVTWDPIAYVYYNDAYSSKRLLGLANIGEFGPSWSYYKETNDHLRAIQLLEEFINTSPNHEKVPEALYWQIVGYYNLTLNFSFLPSNLDAQAQFISGSEADREASEELKFEQEFIMENLARLTNRMLIEYSESQFTPEALTIAALALNNLGEYQSTEEYMRLVVERYPNHNLANNSLIYVARMYRDLGINTGNEPPNLKISYLERAINVYTEVLTRYPSGHVGDEAEEERITVQQMLNSLSDQ